MQNTFTFGIVGLMTMTVVFAVAAWLFSIGYWHFAILWLCCTTGFETGRRTGYPPILMAFCGLIMGALVVIAIAGIFVINMGYTDGAIAMMEKGKTLAGSSGRVLIVLDMTLWLAACSIFFWFVWLLRKTNQNQRRAVG